MGRAVLKAAIKAGDGVVPMATMAGLAQIAEKAGFEVFRGDIGR